MTVDRDEIIWGYRFLLGREPESEEAILAHRDVADFKTLRRNFMSSDEYIRAHPTRSGAGFETEFDLNKPAFVFLHIPKCAGTTLHMALMEHFAATACPERLNGLGHWPAGDLARYRFFSGHFDFPSVHLIPGRRIVVFTVLRRPVERLISLYKFLRAHKLNGQPDQSEGLWLMHLARQFDAAAFFKLPQVAHHPRINNAMVRQLAGSVPSKHWEAETGWQFRPSLADLEPTRALELAQANLASMATFGLVEEMDVSITRIFGALNLPVPKTLTSFQVTDQLPSVNPAFEPVPPITLSAELLEALAPHINLDTQLYDVARTWFFQQPPMSSQLPSNAPVSHIP